MRSFKVERTSDFKTAGFVWVDCLSLTCRDCEATEGEERSSFVPSHTPRVGETLCCPFCGVAAQVPKKQRWG